MIIKDEDKEIVLEDDECIKIVRNNCSWNPEPFFIIVVLDKKDNPTKWIFVNNIKISFDKIFRVDKNGSIRYT